VTPHGDLEFKCVNVLGALILRFFSLPRELLNLGKVIVTVAGFRLRLAP
jgi:hypothetical protein